MSEALSEIEQKIVDLSGERIVLLGLHGHVGMLVREIKRSKEAAIPLPHAMAVRISLAADVAEEVAQAQVFLVALSEQLAALQQEQVKDL
jgi:hypothetical protein